MRIVAGHYGGRPLETPKDQSIRPTSDKVRGAIFNALLSRIELEGARVLDAYCGSGALGLEALSRGAAHCTFCDKAKASLDLCKRNIEKLGAQEHSTALLKDSSKAVPEGPYDLIFLDPPYNKGLLDQTLDALGTAKACHEDTILVLESEKSWHLEDENYSILSEKTYGDTKITFASHKDI